jgi:hypothetical protein
MIRGCATSTAGSYSAADQLARTTGNSFSQFIFAKGIDQVFMD